MLPVMMRRKTSVGSVLVCGAEAGNTAGSPSNACSKNGVSIHSVGCASSYGLKPSKSKIATRPANDSRTLRMSEKCCEPVSQYMPAASSFLPTVLSLSTWILISDKRSGAYWNSSMNNGGRNCRMNNSGSPCASARTWGSSSVTNCRSVALRCRSSVVLPDWRGPVTITTEKYSEARRIACSS